MSELLINKTIRLSMKTEIVFRALTEPERVIAVFPFEGVEIDPREGGAVQFRGRDLLGPFVDSGTWTASIRPTFSSIGIAAATMSLGLRRPASSDMS